MGSSGSKIFTVVNVDDERAESTRCASCRTQLEGLKGRKYDASVSSRAG